MDPEERVCVTCLHSKSMHFHGEKFCCADVDGKNCGCEVFAIGLAPVAFVVTQR